MNQWLCRQRGTLLCVFFVLCGAFFSAGVAHGQTTSCPCGCGGAGRCVFGVFDASETSAIDARINSRWTFTANDFPTGDTGNAVTLTWGIADDGSNIPSINGDPPDNVGSSLINFLDGIRDTESTGGADLTQRAWFSLFQQSTNRISELSGVTFNFESADDGEELLTSAPGGGFFPGPFGEIDTRADIRIGGRPIDGGTGPNTLAVAFSPNSGEVVFDTDNGNFFDNTFNDSVGFRNTLTHELFHALGVSHVESGNAGFLLEPSISTAFDGPQLDDILVLQRNYGDFLEATNGQAGNDTLATATALGLLDAEGPILVGQTVDDTVIGADEVGFVSIDGEADVDLFTFTVSEATGVLLELSPEGATYSQGVEDGVQTDLDSTLLNDLALQLLDSSGELIAESDLFGVGGTESITQLLEAGDYFARVSGSLNDVQLFTLGISTAVSIPEPTAGWFIAGLLGCTRLRRHRRTFTRMTQT